MMWFICSEVRVEGLETLDYLDNLLHRERFTEQADALTFDGEVSLSLSLSLTAWCMGCGIFRGSMRDHAYYPSN